jgi:catechol 1,2-dioxygenase
MSVTRREFVSSFAALGVGGGLVLDARALPTAPSGSLREYRSLLRATEQPAADLRGPARAAPKAPDKLSATETNILGPYYRAGAPYRAKLTPPLEPGTVLLISGRVWAHDTKKPLANARLDVWQANSKGRYDNDDEERPPKKDVFVNRARVVTDELGYYEYETIKPGRYKIDTDLWRPAHIHYAVTAPGYKLLVTQLYFKGDPFNAKDEWIKPSLIIDTKAIKANGGSYEVGTFDVVLSPAKKGG